MFVDVASSAWHRAAVGEKATPQADALQQNMDGYEWIRFPLHGHRRS